MRELKGNWRDLLNCFMVALDLRKLVLAFIGGMITIMVLGLDAFYLARMMPHFEERMANFTWGEKNLQFAHYFLKMLVPAVQTIFSDPVLTIAYLAVVVLTVCVVWSYFGGAITRICAIEITKDERIDLQRSLEFSQGKYNSYFWSLGASAIGFMLFFLVNVIVGVLGRLGWGFGNLFTILLMVLYPLALLSGFIMAMLAIGTVFGYPLYYPSISVEGTDMFDAISRGFSYVFSRPWHYALYQGIGLLLGGVSVGFVWLFSYLVLRLTDVSGGMGMGLDRFDALRSYSIGKLSATEMATTMGWGGWMGAISSFIYLVWMVVILGFVGAYAISYFFSAQTMIYLLLRKKVDGIEMNEIFEEKTEEDPLFPLKAETTAQKIAKPGEGKPIVPLSVMPPAAAPPPAGDSAKPESGAPGHSH